MKVWIDMTNSPHVPFFRPLIGLLEERGHDVRVSARDFAQTLELLDGRRHRAHRRRPSARRRRARPGKVRAMGSRLRALRAWAGPQRFDLALSHASHELPLAARSLARALVLRLRLRVRPRPAHARLAGRDPGRRCQTRSHRSASTGSGQRAGKVRRYPGLKEEYYLSGFSPDPAVLGELGLDPARVLVVVRTPPEVSLYHRHGNPLFTDVLERLGRDRRRAGRRPPADAGAAGRAPRGGAAVARRAGARDRRAEPDRARRPRRLGGRHDEPRGGRARHARLDDVRRAGWARSTRA